MFNKLKKLVKDNITFVVYICFCVILMTVVTCSYINKVSPNENIIQTELIDSDSIVINYGMSMLNAYEQTMTQQQFIQLCKKEKISYDLSKWHVFVSKDAETHEIFKEYMYIKSIGKNEAIYRLTITNNMYKISKRIIKE